MSNGIGLMIECLVAVLLVLTIGYSVLLNKRLKRLKADEMALKATISELITATEIAERAIGGLKMTVRECDTTLAERLRNAERLSAEMGRQLVAGEDVLDRVNRLVAAGRGQAKPEPAVPVIAADTQATVKAAQAFAARARHRTHGVAA